jgi:uncharacterized membrane protein
MKILFLAGALCSGLLIASELGSQIAKSFCQAGKKIDCNTILNSPAATIFGWLKMSDVGIVWFVSCWLIYLLGNLTGHVSSVMAGLFIINCFALLYVPFSVAYQGVKMKRWCVLCLMVQGILVAVALVLSSYYNSIPDFFSDKIALYILPIGFLTVVSVWLWIKPLINDAQQLPYRQQELFRIKRDPEIFNHLLKAQRSVETLPLPIEFRLGQEHAPIQMTIVTNPYCEPCMKAHEQLVPLMERMGEQLSITFRFFTEFNVHDKATIFARHFLSLSPDLQAKAFSDWIHLNNYAAWSELYPVEISDEANSVLREHKIWCDWAHIAKTPTVFLNGYEMPALYGLSDWVYHIRNLEPEMVTQQG